MPLNTKERAEYLDALKTHGGEKAYHAGIEILQAHDSGKGIPKPKVAKGAKPHPGAEHFAAAASAKKFPFGAAGSFALCALQCTFSFNPKKDPINFAACVLQCKLGQGGGGGTGSGGGTGGGTGGGGSK